MGWRRDLAWLPLLVVVAAGLLSLAGPALADPCEAIPEDGPMPAYLAFGATFSGPVVNVIDGDSLCVAVGEGHQNWVEVRLADFFAPESRDVGGVHAKSALERIALGRQAVCVAGLRTYDRIAARCRIDGQPIGDSMRQAGIVEGGRGTPRASSLRPAGAAPACRGTAVMPGNPPARGRHPRG